MQQTESSDLDFIKKQEDQRPLPLFISDFKQMVTENCLFIDKTLFIKEILEMQDQIIIITRPPGWGKSLNLTMLYYFLNLQVNEHDGSPLQPQPHRILFEGGPTVVTSKDETKLIHLNPLRIAEAKDREGQNYLSWQGAYPVIFMNWEEIKGQTFLKAKKHIASKLKQEYIKHLYIKHQQYRKLVDSLRSITAEHSNDEQIQKVDLGDYFKKLIKFLADHHKKKPYILIDAPFNFIHQSQIQDKVKQSLLQLVTGILSSGLQNNDPHFQKAIITDTLPTFELYFGLNNVRVFDILQPRFSRFYGFFIQQVQELVSKFFIILDESKRWTLLDYFFRWGGGYMIPINQQKKQLIFSPQAVISDLKITNHSLEHGYVIDGLGPWTKKRQDSLFKLLLSQKKHLGKLLSLDLNEPTEMRYRKDIELKCLDFSGEIPEECFSHILLHLGYVTGNVNNQSLQAWIPNKLKQKIIRINFQNQAKGNLPHRSYVNLENSPQTLEKMLETFKLLKDSGELNERVINQLFAVHYSLSENRTHQVTILSQTGVMFIPRIPEKRQENQRNTTTKKQ